MRLSGWKGRADQRVKVKGMFIDPVQLNRLPAQFSELKRWRVVVSRENNNDVMQLNVVLDQSIDAVGDAADEIAENLEKALKAATNLSGKVNIVNDIPNDGIVVEDQREYEAS